MATPLEAPKTWFYLVSGGGERPEEEHSARSELKKILHTIVEQKLAEKDHIVFISARPGRLDRDVYSAEGLRNSKFALDVTPVPGFEGITCNQFPSSIEAKSCDNAVIIFIGHGNNPKDWFVMPPSASPSDNELGNFVFFMPNGEKILAHPCQTLKNTLFISIACYSGNAFQKCEPSDNLLAVCTADPDHPASFDPILGSFFAKFFSDGVWRHKSISRFCEELQEQYLKHPYILKMKDENLHQNEEDFEMERKDAAEWAGSDFIGYVPCHIPRDLWEMFQEVEHLKRTMQVEDIPETTKRVLVEHVSKLEHKRFDLMRMYKHKPNNRLFVWGAKDTIGRTTWSDFLHLPAEVLRSPTRFPEKVPTYVH